MSWSMRYLYFNCRYFKNFISWIFLKTELNLVKNYVYYKLKLLKIPEIVKNNLYAFMNIRDIFTKMLYKIQIIICYSYRLFKVFYYALWIFFLIQFLVGLRITLVIEPSLKNISIIPLTWRENAELIAYHFASKRRFSMVNLQWHDPTHPANQN